MADSKISALTATTTLAATDELVVASSGTSKKITGTNLLGGAAILAPASSTRNVIQPTGAAVTPVTVRAHASQSANRLNVESSAGVRSLVVGHDGVIYAGEESAAGAWDGIERTSLFGGDYAFDLVLSRAASVDGAKLTEANMGTFGGGGVWIEVAANPTVDNSNIEVYGQLSKATLWGTKRVGIIQGAANFGWSYSTKASGSGNAIDILNGLYNAVYTENTGDVSSTVGAECLAAAWSSGVHGTVAGLVSSVHRISGTGTITRFWGVRASTTGLGSGIGGTVTESKGVSVENFGGSKATNSYGVHIEAQSGAATKSYAIYSEGGESRFLAGTATVIPLVAQGAASQSGDLQQWQNNSGAVLSSIGSGGWLEMLEQSVPASPSANRFRMFARDSGGGKTQLVVVFESGNTVVVAEDF